MWSEFVFLVTIIFTAEASLPDNNDPMITFKVQIEDSHTLTCDHSEDKKQQNEYTVLEGEQFTIFTEYNKIISHVICHGYTNENDGFHYQKTIMKNVTKFMVVKSMGNLWNCTILTHRYTPSIKPLVHYKDADYAAAYCFMKIHVRQKEPPQTMLVNNRVIKAARKNLLEKDVDFIAEYQYVDGDIVNVACANLVRKTPLTMQYEMAGAKSDNYTMKYISSSTMIGFVTKLHSGHNNSYMICTNTETTDYTKVMIRFVMQTKPNIISVAINGMVLRPILTDQVNNHYEIQYKFAAHQIINVTCEIKEDMKFFMYKPNHTIWKPWTEDKKTAVIFDQNPGDDKSLSCSAGNNRKGVAELVYIKFSTADIPTDQYSSTHMELPSNGTVMQFYRYGEFKLTYVIIYEFMHGEELQLTCGPLLRGRLPAPVLYLQLNNDDTRICRTEGCKVNKTFQHLTRKDVNTSTVCWLKEVPDPGAPPTAIDTVLKEIRVILRERALTTTTTLPANIVTDNTAADPATSSGYNSTLVYSLSAFGVVTVIVILASLSYICIKKQYCVRPNAPIPTPEIDPASVYYENLLSVFAPINEREAVEAARREEYEEVH